MTQPANSPPVAVHPGVRTEIAYPTNQASQLNWALVINLSSWVVTVDQGGSQFGYLPAFTMNIYPVSAVGTPIGVTPDPTAADATGQFVRVSWYEVKPDGQYPMSLTAQAIAASIAGLVSTSPQLRPLASFNTPNNAANGTTTIVGLLPTDRYLWVVQTGGGNGLWLTYATGGQSGLVFPVQDVASTIHTAQVPLFGQDTSVSLGWISLAFTAQTGGTFAVFASAIPVVQPVPTGIATAAVTTATSVGLTWTCGTNLVNAPAAVRLLSCSTVIHLPTAAATSDFKFSSTQSNTPIMTVTAAAGTDTVQARSFGGNGVIVANGALTDAAVHDFSPQQLVLGTTSASTSTSLRVNAEILAFV